MADDERKQIEGYLDNLRTQRQLSGNTLSSYGRDLHELQNLAGAVIGDKPLATLTHFHIRKFAAQLHSHGINPRSIARKLSCWRGFFEWLAEHDETLRSNPVNGVKAPKRSRPLPKALAADDAVRLVEQGAPGKAADATLQLCNRAMFELLYSSGLRVSELSGLDVRYLEEAGYASAGWVDLEAGEVTVTGKGQRRRSVPVGAAALTALRNWLTVRATLVRTDPRPLFLSERGTRISARVVQLRLKAHAQALGIPSDVHPHVLRHSFASHVLQSSGDLRAVQEMLGHASIAATQVYTSLDFQRLAQVYDAAHPRAKKQ
ncbi:MAG TPA: tyrosine recombinase XerC [Burkholderiaceae bacterium]|jgi:integrase/recombinase XerC